MIILKSLIHDNASNWLEATWVDRIPLPNVDVPESFGPTTRGEDGSIVPGELIPAHTVKGGVQDTVIKCHSYADVQMQMFRDDAAQMGTDLTEHEALIALVESRIVPYVAPPAPVPTSISPRQIRQALTRKGLRAAVEAAVAAGDQDIKDWWEFSTVCERNNEHVISMATALGVTDAQLDDLWTLGATL